MMEVQRPGKLMPDLLENFIQTAHEIEQSANLINQEELIEAMAQIGIQAPMQEQLSDLVG
jgi:hypothetical protein